MLKRALGLGAVGSLMVANVVALLVGGTARRPRFERTEVWRVPMAAVRSLVHTSLIPGGRPLIVAQSQANVALVAPDGRVVRSVALGDLVSMATGDLNGDGADEIVLLRAQPLRVQARGADLQPLWSVDLPALPRAPSRVLAADLDGDRQAEIVVGGPLGLQAFDARGRALWTHGLDDVPGDDGELRGLDDLRVGPDARRVVSARRDGMLLVLDAAGRVVLARPGPEIRRLRAGNADDESRGELLVGYDSGSFAALDEAGRPRVMAALGEPVVELRRVELDGRRETAEIALGGKAGEVKVVRAGQTLFEARVGARVSDLAGVDVDGDGRDELLAGAEGGSVSVFDETGEALVSYDAGGQPERIVAAGSPRGPRLIVVAAGSALVASRVEARTPPLWYSPLLAGLVGLGGLVAFGLGLGLLPRAGGTPSTPADAARAPLLASLARLDELIAAGHVSPAGAAERRAQLERALAAPATPTAAASTAPPRAAPPPPPRRRG